MKTKKNPIIAKLSLLTLILLPISPSHGMMARLRLGLQENLKAADVVRNPVMTAPAIRTLRTNNSNRNSSQMAKARCALLGITGAAAIDFWARREKSWFGRYSDNFAPIATALDSAFFAKSNDYLSDTQSFTADVMVNTFLKNPRQLSEKQIIGVVSQYPDQIVESIRNNTNKFYSYGAYVESEEKINHSITMRHIYLNLQISTRQLFSEMLLQKAPDILLDFYFTYSGDLNHKNQNLLDTYIKEYVLKNNEPRMVARLLWRLPGLFSEEEQIQLVLLHEEAVLNILEKLGAGSLILARKHFQKIISSLVLKKGSREIIEKVLSTAPQLFSEEETESLVNKLNSEHGIFLTEQTKNGPFFSNYLSKNIKNYFDLFPSEDQQPHFYNLLPIVGEHVQKEYAQDRIVLFHGQKSIWVLLEMIYSRLLALKNNTQPSDNFKHLRFQEQSNISAFWVWMIGNFGANYGCGLKKNNDNDAILFTNLHPAANNAGSNSWHYAANNLDLSGDETFFYTSMIKKMFSDLDMAQEYQSIQQKSPQFFDDLYQSFNAVVRTQGNHGNLVAISMPKNLAKQLVYSTHGDGRPMPLTIQKEDKTITTTNVVTLAENYNHISFHNAYALIFDNRIINKEAAQKENVTIRYFNTFEDTEGYQKIVKILEEKVSTIKNHTA